MIDPTQIVMARAGLGWSQEKLAEKSGVSLPTVQRIERRLNCTRRSLHKIECALIAAGCGFPHYDGNDFNATGPTVTLRVKVPEHAKNWVGSHGL